MTIILKDHNDNSPVFISSGPVTVNEAASSGDAIYTFSATDADEGKAGNVQYHLKAGSNYFSIGTNDGVLRVLRVFDRENPPPESTLQIEVVAADLGSPALSSSVIVLVEITDANDNTPVFVKTSFTERLDEDSTIGTYFV